MFMLCSIFTWICFIKQFNTTSRFLLFFFSFLGFSDKNTVGNGDIMYWLLLNSWTAEIVSLRKRFPHTAAILTRFISPQDIGSTRWAIWEIASKSSPRARLCAAVLVHPWGVWWCEPVSEQCWQGCTHALASKRTNCRDYLGKGNVMLLFLMLALAGQLRTVEV